MNIIWNVIPLNTPSVLRGCNKCGGKRQYVSSDQFRINAQGRNLDIWLIYKCLKCDHTWNMAVYSRVKPESLDCDEYQTYIDNDVFRAFQCAFDKSILAQNGADVCYGDVRYEIEGKDVDISCLSETVEISLVTEFDLNVRISKILRQKLSLSQYAFRALVDREIISSSEGVDLEKAKLKSEVRVLIKNAP